MTAPTGNTLVDAVLTAAADQDAVRCAQVMTVAYANNGQSSFTRSQLVTLWGGQYPGDLSGTGQQAISLRQRRAEPLLSRTVAVIRDGAMSLIGDAEVLAWLGARDMIAGSLPPGTSVPVNPGDVDEVTDLIENRS